MSNFENICKMTQTQLKHYLHGRLKSKYKDVIVHDGYIYAKGSYPVMLVAHMDTVHKKPVRQIIYTDKGNVISSPQGIGGDDRCGIAMILEVIKEYNCSVIFTEDEEIGCVGANKFIDDYLNGDLGTIDVNYIIELDRKGNNEAVFYDCDNPEFKDFILEHDDWKFNYGSFTDIINIAPTLGVAAVNLSCGYYNAHTTKEYVVLSEMRANIAKVKHLLADTTEDDVFKFFEAKHSFDNYNNYDFNNEYDESLYYICADYKGQYIESEVYAITKAEAIGQFLIDHPDVCVNDIVNFIKEN